MQRGVRRSIAVRRYHPDVSDAPAFPKADPASVKKLGALRALTSSWDQRDAVLKDGWASIGTAEGNRDVAEACASALVKTAAVK